MDALDRSPRDESPTADSAGATNSHKRPLPQNGNDSASKKIRPSVEIPAVYSDAVRKKLASTTRTGQACDRCKERKMKCDTDPIACQPCRQKNLRCYTTDRVTGQARERGQSDRAETELQMLRDQNAAYHRRYGPLEPGEYPVSQYSPISDSNKERSQQHQSRSDEDQNSQKPHSNMPDLQYIGWPAPAFTEALHSGPVNGTNVDILDGIIDIADFPCEAVDDYPMQDLNVFNMSRTSVVNTLTGYQNVTYPRFPSKDQAIQDANTFLIILSQYVPILHKPSFLRMVNNIYDQPHLVTQSERVQLAVVLAIVEQQMATRNHKESAEKLQLSHHHMHYALTYYRELSRERTLASMQALALILVHFRNLPKPGYTWGFGHDVLVRIMEAEYHRDPDKIKLPLAENNPLAKEMRKRVFHSVLGICVTTGCRVGRPAPWQFCHMDVPLPMAIKDSEISESGVATPLSGSCDFWPCLQLAKLLPLLTEMYNHVTSVRRSEQVYVKTVETLHSKIDAWRRDWDESIRNEDRHVNLQVATLLIEGWAAEYSLNLYHPALCPTRSPETMDRHLDICHKQAQRLLKSFHVLSNKYKGVDFTWHSTVAYALGFGVTLHVYQRKKAPVATTQFESMKNELKGWMSLMAYADLVLRTNNYLQHLFEPRVRRLEADYQEMMRGNTSASYRQQQNSTPKTLSHRQPIKHEASPLSKPSSAAPEGMSSHHTHAQQDLTAMQYHSNQHISNTRQLASSPQYSTQLGGTSTSYITHNGGGTPTYATFTSAPQYSTLPTSLAPLLNDQTTGFMTYQPPTTPQNEFMIFHPTHYTDGPATMMWPMITMPQSQNPNQHQQPDTNSTMHFS